MTKRKSWGGSRKSEDKAKHALKLSSQLADQAAVSNKECIGGQNERDERGREQIALTGRGKM